MKIKLDYPITTPNGTVTEIELRRCKAKDLLRVQKITDDGERELQLLGELTGLMVEDITEMDIADYAKLQKALTDMVKGPTSK